MNFEHLDSYESAIKQITAWLIPPYELDVLANDREDYESELRLTSWSAQLRFRARYGFSSPAERRYVHRTLWNMARNIKRARFHAERRKEAIDLPEESYEVDGMLEARNVLAGLESHFDEERFHILRRLGEADGRFGEVYDPDSDGTYKAFHKRVSRLRATAKRWMLRAS